MTFLLVQKVLLAVPDANLRLAMESALRQAGFEVVTASNTGTAIKRIAADQPDFIVIDKDIPHMGGVRLCRRLRMNQNLPEIGIVMLLAPEDLTEGIPPRDMGADDYLVKPFAMADLLTRLATLQPAHHYDQINRVLRAGNIQMIPDEWVVYVEDELVDLTEIEYRLLLELLRVKGRVLTRDTLMERVWGHRKTHELETRTLDVHMSRLRHKLGISAENIITVRNVGYRYNVAPGWLNQ